VLGDGLGICKSAQDPVVDPSEHGSESVGSIRGEGEFCD
jgi:hypothetical protein